ncbi:MAG: TlpA disulfide reductase family protein [Sphingomicrobium sp.]
MPAASISYTKSLVAKKGRLLGFSIRKGTGPSEIKLGEPGQLDLRLTKRFGSKESIGADLLKQGSAIAYGTVAGSAVFAVPQGAFDLMLAEAEIVQTTRPLVFAGPVRKTLALELQPTSWARNLGKPAPAFTPTDLRNAKSVDPEALRGKWVLVDFWATWCLPCVQEMPKIISFYNEHAKDRGRFEIVAVHSPDGKSFEAIQSAYRSLVTKTWAGKDLPFPLVFDATGATQKRWGVEAYPTTLLIDPQGRLVGAATIDDLAKRL